MRSRIAAKTVAGSRNTSSLWGRIVYYRYFYYLLIPVIAWYIIFTYLPMYGVTLAFKSFNYSKGILGSPWIGLQNFQQIVTDLDFWNAFKNTVAISVGILIFCFPMPIILSILLNELSHQKMKKIYQTVFTFPHFISWVIIAGIITNILSQEGIYNQFVILLGGQPVSLLTQESTFRPIIYITRIWKEMGWDSIIYLAAIAGINAELYQSAAIDGANRFQQIIHVTWPGIRGTVSILFILAVGQVMSAGASFDQIFNLYSAPVFSVADTIDTFIYRTSFTTGADFGYMTSVGMIKSVINLALLWLANFVIKNLDETGLF
jgi:ABC-type polysaccharide transport system, permease component